MVTNFDLERKCANYSTFKSYGDTFSIKINRLESIVVIIVQNLLDFYSFSILLVKKLGQFHKL